MALATMGSSVLGKFTELFVDYLVVPIGRQFGYLFCYKNNIKNLTEHVKNLENVEAGVKRRADAAERNLEIVGEDVQDWLKNADVIKNEADKVLDRTADVEKGCLNGWCPNLLVRYSLSRNATKNSEKLVELRNKGDEYTTFANPAPPMQKIVITEDCKDFDSRMTTTKEVIDALEDDEIRMIGICGMPGVGKTTMVQEVAKRVKGKKLFDEVVMVVVSNNQDFMKMQSDSAGMLGLTFEIDETSLLVRANKLRTRLSNGKRILVILDDLWEELKLEELGIPFGVGQHRCKVLLTSRNKHVCVEMGCQKNFAVGLLSEDEAWNLFKEMAGIEDDNTELQPVAKDVADECRGLPLAIVTLAKALKNKEKNSWNVTLRKLRRNTAVPKRVETAIKLSYDMLETDESKSLLRLCSLFPEDYDSPIESLVRYAVGLRLLENVETVLEARETVYSLIDQLKSCHLMLVGDEEESVKLHDVVRDVCISIASKDTDDAYMVRCDAGLKKWPQEDTFRHYSAISLKFDEFNEFPTGLDCPNLKLLQLQGRYGIRCTNFDSGGFFEGMTELRVVSLRSMFLQLPPPPLKSLMNLRTLCLDFCKLDTTDVSMIGSLQSLEILTFFMSTLRALPSEIGQLGKLKLLDFRCKDVPNGLPLPPGVLSNLNRLEELYMGNNFSEMLEHVELNSLADLNTLQIFLGAEDMPKLKDFCFENLRRFKISVESFEFYHYFDSFDQYHFQNELVLKHSDMGMLFGIGFMALLERSEIIWLEDMTGLGRNLFDELDEKESVNWKELLVQACYELEYLIHRALPGKRFGQLKKLTLLGLHAMKSLFTGSVVKGFVQLQELQISWCFEMKYIVAKEEEEGKKSTDKIEFPKLTKLSLEDLPMLLSFYPSSDNVAIGSLFHRQVLLPSLEILDLTKINIHIVDCHMQVGSFDQLQCINVQYCGKLLNVAVAAQLELFQSFQNIQIRGCNALEAVFDLEGLKVKHEQTEVILGQLESLDINYSPNLMHIWKMVPEGLQGFHNLKTLTIVRCWRLRYLLSPIVVNLLVNLQELHLEDCKMMEEIIETWKGHPEIRIVDDIVTKQEGEEVIVVPRLSTLHLWELENLTVFNSGKCGLQFPSLAQVDIINCPELKTFCSGPLCTPKLERVMTSYNDEWVWMGDLNKTIQHIREREATTMISQKDEEDNDFDDDGAEEDDDYDGAEEEEKEEKEEEEDDVKKKKQQQ